MESTNAANQVTAENPRNVDLDIGSLQVHQARYLLLLLEKNVPLASSQIGEVRGAAAAAAKIEKRQFLS